MYLSWSIKLELAVLEGSYQMQDTPGTWGLWFTTLLRLGPTQASNKRICCKNIYFAESLTTESTVGHLHINEA